MQTDNYSVYKHTGPTGRIYIGITKQEPSVRWKNGKGYADNPRFSNAIKKYGWDSFDHEIIASGLCKEEAEKIEADLIAFYDSANREHGYNIALGGNANAPTDETKKKISESLRDAWVDSETRKRMTEHMRGVKRSAESRENISKAQKKRFQDSEQRRLVSERQKGKKRSEEARRKTSESLLRYYADAENRRKLQETRARVRNRATPVVCIDTGEIFDSVIDAAKKYTTAHQNIIKVCRGQRAHAGGRAWRYAEG